MTCTHPRIITYHDADTGQPVQLWACAECGRRFEPLRLDDEALLQRALEALDPPEHLRFGGTGRLKAAAIAALKERLT